MGQKLDLVKNAVGRMVPTEVNGKKAIPFNGVAKHSPTGRKTAPPISSCNDYPLDGNKIVDSLQVALQKCGLKDGMTISSHHHFRNGDLVMNQVFNIASEKGIKDLMWFPSAAFPCHEPIIKYMEDGVIHHIEGSLNGPLGKYASEGNMDGLAVLRSHGGWTMYLLRDYGVV